MSKKLRNKEPIYIKKIIELKKYEKNEKNKFKKYRGSVRITPPDFF